MAKITANNIFIGSITSDKLDSSVASGLATATNANTIATIASTVAAAAFSSANTISAILANTSTPIITSITITDSSYNTLDDTAANTTGGFCIITGSGFVSTPTVVFGTTSAPAVSFISSTTLRVQIPALTAASYPVYVVNSNGGTAIRVNGVTTSSFPAWSTGATLSNQTANTAFSVNLSASSDSNITYSNTTALPAGTTLAANGLFSGTVSIGTQTTYTFTVKATDVQLQDADRTFSLTVTVTPATRLFLWGDNTYGSLGLNDRVARSSPVQVGTNTNWSKLAMHGQTSLAIKTDGTLWGWGRNDQNQIGDGSATHRSSPIQIGAATNWNIVERGTASGGGSAAITTANTLFMWGNNSFGQLGDNSTGSGTNTPTQLAGSWSNIGLASNSAAGVKTDGTLWLWGRNSYGMLGLGNTVHRSSPAQMGTGTDWSRVAIAYPIGVAIKTNGTMWSWGSNSWGQQGKGDLVLRSSPTQIGALTNWSFVTTDGYACIASRTDGTLWGWGRNQDAGQLGTSTGNVSSPVQIAGSTWSQIQPEISTGFHGAALKTDGTLWIWGRNNEGQSGLNSTTSAVSPRQVGAATNWTLISLGYRVSGAITTN